ncbi:hypothetical protein [Acinetobacter sp. MD2]|uniref:hypothetical protein n=1 Tax=Acinetobacter sp. MD2 TaxID=2600066 RepID=UPI002D1E506D|nr:hypothetical protein [Acinetobacter sp. MD2]MEB3768399.1 hypothetical protein [Acinetobacter sp. MD2]
MSNVVIDSKSFEKKKSLEALIAHRLKIKTKKKLNTGGSVYFKNRVLAESSINYTLSN